MKGIWGIGKALMDPIVKSMGLIGRGTAQALTNFAKGPVDNAALKTIENFQRAGKNAEVANFLKSMPDDLIYAGQDITSVFREAHPKILSSIKKLEREIDVAPDYKRLIDNNDGLRKTYEEMQTQVANMSDLEKEMEAIKTKIKMFNTEMLDSLEIEGILSSKALNLESKKIRLVQFFRGKVEKLKTDKIDLVSKDKNFKEQVKYVDELKSIESSLAEGEYKKLANDLFSADQSTRIKMNDALGHDVIKKITDASMHSASASVNLNNPAKFIDEYVNLNTYNPQMAEIFKTNKDNRILLSKIKRLHPELVENALKKQFYSAGVYEQIFGLTPEILVKRLGIGGAITGATVIATKTYAWINNHSRKTNNNADQLIASLDKIQTSEQGRVAIEEIKQNVRNIQGVSQNANEELAKGPQAAGTYTQKIMGGLGALGNTISNKWNTVKAGATNKAQVAMTEMMMNSFFGNQHQMFNDLGSEVSQYSDQMDEVVADVEETTEEQEPLPAQETKTTNDPEDIKKTQSLLSKYYSAIKPTGKVDKNTVFALQSLEKRFNKITQDNQFSGQFVDQNSNIIIDSNSLQQLIEKIKKY